MDLTVFIYNFFRQKVFANDVNDIWYHIIRTLIIYITFKSSTPTWKSANMHQLIMMVLRITISRKVHCSQGSTYNVSHFVKLLDSVLVRATVARITTRGLNKIVDVEWSTIFNWNYDWMFATRPTVTKANHPDNFTISHFRMSTIQPAWPRCTTSICWHTRCWHLSSSSSHETIPSPGE